MKKKQKELSKKHSTKDENDSKSESIEEDDSDLASIARELQNEDEDSDNIFKNSPFIKKPDQPKVRHYSDNTTPLPEKEFSFIRSNPDSKPSIEEPPAQTPQNASKVKLLYFRNSSHYNHATFY